jgi:DNA-binding response OmpR family regulator
MLEPRRRPFPALVYGSLDLLAYSLREGALDFVVAPPAAAEVAARLRGRIDTFETGLRGADPGVSKLREELSTSPRELRLLRLLIMAEGKVLTRESLSSALWGIHSPGSRKLDMLVSALRKHLDANPELTHWKIQALRNEGYSLVRLG